jgi:hypothetical protein
MARRKKAPHFTQPAEFKVIKLKRSGPRPGQSVSSWEAGKCLADARWDKQRDLNLYKLL